MQIARYDGFRARHIDAVGKGLNARELTGVSEGVRDGVSEGARDGTRIQIRA